jgi:hypothetical protein
MYLTFVTAHARVGNEEYPRCDPDSLNPIQISGRKETNTSNQYHPRDRTDLNDTLHPERVRSYQSLSLIKKKLIFMVLINILLD